MAQFTVPSTGLGIIQAAEGLGPLLFWVSFVCSPHVLLVMPGGVLPHLALIWVVITQSQHLQCAEVCPAGRLNLQ